MITSLFPLTTESTMVTPYQIIRLNLIIAITSAVDNIYQKEGSTALLTFPKDKHRTGNGWCLFDSDKYLHSDVIFQFRNGKYINLGDTQKHRIFNIERSKWFQLQIINLTLDDAGTYVCKWSLDSSRYDIELHVLNNNGNVSNLHHSNTTLILQVVTRQDTGLYQCRATNRIGNSSSPINVTIQYPPTVELVVSDDFIECVLQPGIPASITLFQLEHQSAVGVHIRGNQSLLSDRLLLQKSYITYETNGIYVCQASNGVADIDGFAIHNNSTIFKYSGSPVFSNENTNAVFGELGQPCLIKFMIYSFPILKELRLQKKFSNHSTIHNVESYQIIESSLSYTEHDTEETIQGYGIIYETNLLTNEDFTVYNIWAKNSFGESFYTYKILPLDKENEGRNMKVHFWISVSISAVLVLYMGMCHLYCFIRSAKPKGLAIIQQEHSYDEINVVSYELDGIHQPEDEVNEQSLDGNFVDNDVYRPNVTDDSANLMVHIAQTSPTDTHRNDYENMYQPIVRERHDSHCYSQCVSDGLD